MTLVLQIAAGVALGLILGAWLFVILSSSAGHRVLRVVVGLTVLLIAGVALPALAALLWADPNGPAARTAVGLITVPVVAVLIVTVQRNFHRAEDWWRPRVAAWWRRARRHRPSV